MDGYDPDLRTLEERKAQAQKTTKREKLGWNSGLIWIMSDRRGRRFISWLLDQTKFDKDASSPTDEGKRRVGTLLWSRLRSVCPEFIPMMWEETRDRSDHRRSDRNGGRDSRE